MPEDLLAHDCIRLVRGRRIFDRWAFTEAGRRREVHVHGTLATTSSEVILGWATAGLGIALKLAGTSATISKAARSRPACSRSPATRRGFISSMPDGATCRRACAPSSISAPTISRPASLASLEHRTQKSRIFA